MIINEIYKLLEVLPLSVAKKYTKLGNQNFENSVDELKIQRDKIFKGSKNGRIIIPFKYDSSIEPKYDFLSMYSIYLELYNYLEKTYPQYKFDGSENSNDEKELLNIYTTGKFKVIDKETNNVILDDGIKYFFRKMKLPPDQEVNNLLTKLGNLKPSKLNPNDYNIIISNHPYDVAGMSTNRQAWRSCKEINTGINKHFVASEVGRLAIAYLSKKNPNGMKASIGLDSKDKHILTTTKDPVGEPLLRLNIVPW